MAAFDTDLEAPAIQEGNLDPILPEERFIFELIGFERSEPDQYRSKGGIRWTFLVYDEDGHPFEFQDEPFALWRTSNINANGQPLFNIGTQAHDWASALLGRTLGVDDTVKISELRNKRMSAMVVWRNKKPPAQGKTFDLASLRHVSVGIPSSRKAPSQVTAEPSSEAIDRALLVTALEKKVARLKKLNTVAGNAAQAAVAASDLEACPMGEIERLTADVQAAIAKELED